MPNDPCPLLPPLLFFYKNKKHKSLKKRTLPERLDENNED